MKWIGQHIWSFISRFRSDVYLENVTESAQDHVVGIDADGKLYKQDVSTGDMTGVDITVGTGLDISQSNTTGGDYTSTINLDLTEVGVSGSANQLLTDDGDGTVTSESGLTWDGDVFNVSSSSTARPNFTLTNTANHAKPPTLNFVKDKGAAGNPDDIPGNIIWTSDNANQTLKDFAQIYVSLINTTSGDEAAGMFIEVLSSNGSASNSRNAFTAVGSASANTVNVDLGYGTSSTATVAGSLRLNGSGLICAGDLTTTASNFIVDASSNIELNADGGEIVFKDDTATLAKIDTNGISFIDNTSAGVRFEGTTDDAHNTALLATDPTGARICMLPDASGTLALLSNIENKVHVQIKDFGSYLFYLFHDDNWYSAGSTTLAILGSSTSPSDLSSGNSKYQGRIASYTAPANCVLKKLCFSFYWSSSVVNSADIDFAFSKFTPISDGSSATITMNNITATDCNGSYTENAPYYKTFEFSGSNATLSAGDSFAFHMRTTGGSGSQRVLVYGEAILSVELS